MNNLEIYKKVKAVPEEAKKQIRGGRVNGFTDINPMWRIKTLTECFGPCGIGWYYDVEKEWTETVGTEICAFVNIKLYIKYDGEWSKPIHGTGGSRLAEKQKAGIYVSDECFKMATTDAISVACKQLGIGADVYWDKDRTKYDLPCKKEEKPVTKEDIEKLRKYLEDNGISQEKVCSIHKVQNIESLSDRQIRKIMEKNILGDLKQKCGVG